MSAGPNPNDVTVAIVGLQFEALDGRIGAQSRFRGARRGRGQYTYEVIKGTEFSSNGHMVHKLQIVDHDLDLYIKRVVDLDTGETIKDLEQPLSDHVGCGSAKAQE